MIRIKTVLQLLIILLFIGLGKNAHAQTSNDDDGDSKPTKPRKVKGFHAGIYMGTLFANKYSAFTYDGHGFSRDGVKNNFNNSLMNYQIHYLHGGGNYQPDQIAPALGVATTDWSFDSTDMPIKMRYNVAFMVGFNGRYCFDKSNAIIFNVNASKLTATGDFTIVTYNNVNSNPNLPQSSTLFKTFALIGTEQRLLWQVGYQSIGTSNDNLNFVWEMGIDMTMAKADKNFTNINGLPIDLNSYYYQPIPGYSPYRPRNLTGIGYGFFGGMGLDLALGGKWTAQLLYSPSFDKINIGDDPRHKLQNAIGFRGYYNF